MALIKQHLDNELNKPKSDVQTIIELRKILENKTISFEEWQISGKFIPSDMFAKEYPLASLNQECTDVILYYGDLWIEVLKTDMFFVRPGFVTNDIKSAERELWQKNIGNFF